MKAYEDERRRATNRIDESDLSTPQGRLHELDILTRRRILTPSWKIGAVFRRHLEQRVTADRLERHERRTAPDEVIHRRVDGQTIIQRRQWRARE